LSDGTVPRDDVITVLTSKGVSVTIYTNGDILPDMYRFEFNGDVETRVLPARVGRYLLQYFQRNMTSLFTCFIMWERRLFNEH
jgi:hypothetical protein